MIRQARRRYLRSLLLFVVVGIVLVSLSMALSIILDDIFEGKTPSILRLVLAVVLSLVVVIIFELMTRKSDRELRRLEEAQKRANDAEAEPESMESDAITIDPKKINRVRLD